jgi:hypothetical protein
MKMIMSHLSLKVLSSSTIQISRSTLKIEEDRSNLSCLANIGWILMEIRERWNIKKKASIIRREARMDRNR